MSDLSSRTASRRPRAGISSEKLLALPAFRESLLFDDAERAALALTEAITPSRRFAARALGLADAGLAQLRRALPLGQQTAIHRTRPRVLADDR